MYRADFARCPNDGALLELRTEDPLIGVTIGGHYVIDGFVGEGGMGRVYRAHHTRLQRRNFAIKVLLGDLAVALPTRLRFAQEADAASRLDHPNVVSVIDFGKSDDGLMFLAMELVEGRSLGDLLHAEGALVPSRVVALSRQLCLGLAHAHARGLVHRDFKPDNVIVVATAGGEVPRILDFGLALTNDDEPAPRLTTVGFALGTPSYAAPEQTHGETVDLRADLFALGVTMYEMLTGQLPYDGTSAEVVLLNARATPPPMTTRGGLGVPTTLEALVGRLMSRSPSDRFASALEVVEALDALAIGQTTARTATTAATAAPRNRRGHSGLALGGLVIGAALIAVLANRTPPTSPPAQQPLIVTAPVTQPSVVAQPAPATVTVAAVAPPPSAPRAPLSQATTRAPTRRPAIRVAEVPRTPPRTAEATPPPPLVEAVGDVTPPAVTPPASAPPAAIPLLIPTPTPRPAMTHLSQTALTALTARGSLSDSVLRRGVERVMPVMAECARRAAVVSPTSTARVRATFVVDDTRRATAIGVDGESVLARCVSAALVGVRTQSAPDVGTVSVSVDIVFTGEI